MADTFLKDLLKEYELKRSLAIRDAEERKEILYHNNPRLEEIDREIHSFALYTAKAILQSNQEQYQKDLNEKLEKLKLEKQIVLSSLGLTDSYLLPHFECRFCEDTGYLKSAYKTTMCNCLKQKLLNEAYNKANIGNLETENFSTFADIYYSDVIDASKYNATISPKQNINMIKDISLHFIRDFDNPSEKNLLFTGPSGLGKTFLSNCIANEMIKLGKTVLYQTAPVMFNIVLDSIFNKTPSSKYIYDTILNVDLLIIDDLGTESPNDMKHTELFNILNTRLLNQHHQITKTIISTNLTLNNLFSKYDARIISRIAGYYNSCRFFGEDIRYKSIKKQN